MRARDSHISLRSLEFWRNSGRFTKSVAVAVRYNVHVGAPLKCPFLSWEKKWRKSELREAHQLWKIQHAVQTWMVTKARKDIAIMFPSRLDS
jgi:hypothetical protein